MGEGRCHYENNLLTYSEDTINNHMMSKMLRQDKLKHLEELYVIIDTQFLRGRSRIEAARQVIRGGASIVQLRDKHRSRKELLPIAYKLRSLCAEQGVLFIVNDYLDIALATDADGLHLGQNDLPISVARKLLPIDKLLGCSARTVRMAVRAESAGADYISAGCIYPTSFYEYVRIIGVESLSQIKKVITLPLVAIGGVDRDNVAEVIAAGADTVAVDSAVLQAKDMVVATRKIVDILNETKKRQNQPMI